MLDFWGGRIVWKTLGSCWKSGAWVARTFVVFWGSGKKKGGIRAVVLYECPANGNQRWENVQKMLGNQQGTVPKNSHALCTSFGSESIKEFPPKSQLKSIHLGEIPFLWYIDLLFFGCTFPGTLPEKPGDLGPNSLTWFKLLLYSSNQTWKSRKINQVTKHGGQCTVATFRVWQHFRRKKVRGIEALRTLGEPQWEPYLKVQKIVRGWFFSLPGW